MLLVLALLALVAGQPKSWTIKCGIPYDPVYRRWNSFHCEPTDITVNVGDNVTIENLRNAVVFTINTAQTLIDPVTTATNSLCVLGRAGGQMTDIGYLQVGPIDSEVGPTGVVTINSLTTPYSSGFLVKNDTDIWAVYTSGIVVPSPPPYNPYWTVNFTIPGVFEYHGCLDFFVSGNITVLPEGETPPLTPEQVAQTQDDYLANVPNYLAALQDSHNIGDGKYLVPDYFNNSEGFKTHIVINGFIDPATQHYFAGFIPPSFTITEGDTVAFQSDWYTGPLDNPWNVPHSIRLNTSITVPGWRSTYIDPTTSAAWFAIPDSTGLNYTFVKYFPYWQDLTPIGLFDNPKTWLGYGDPDNYVDGELSVAAFQASVRGISYLNRRNITFLAAGQFPFICALHVPVGMDGNITVVPRPRTDQRTGFQVDATLNRFHVSHFIAALSASWGTKYQDNAVFKILSATHGILTIVGPDGVLRTDPLLVTLGVGFNTYDNSEMTDTQLNDFGSDLIDFLAVKTWTLDSQWSATYVITVNNNTYAGVSFIVQYGSASYFGSSLLLLLVSLLVLLQ